jgi:hypothetical protein
MILVGCSAISLFLTRQREEMLVIGNSKQRGLALLAIAVGIAFPATRVHGALALYSTMDDIDIVGTAVQDETFPAEDGVLQPNVTTGIAGQIGQAIDANTTGTAASVSYGNVLNPGSTDMTAMLWFNADSVKSQFLARKGNSGSGDEGWSLSLESRNSGEFLRVFGRVNATGVASNADRALLLKDFDSNTSTGVWHHVALVMHAAGSIELFVDGSTAGITPNVWGDTFTVDANGISNTSSLLLGVGTGSGTDIKMDDFSIFNEALSAESIATIYGNGLNGIGANVPEPSALIAMLCGVGFTVIVGRRRIASC